MKPIFIILAVVIIVILFFTFNDSTDIEVKSDIYNEPDNNNNELIQTYLNCNNMQSYPNLISNQSTNSINNQQLYPNLISNQNTNSTNNTNQNIIENFTGENNKKIIISSDISFKKIKTNKLYYGLPCQYIKNDSFYDALNELEFISTEDITKAALIVPCSYESTEKEIIDLEKNGIKNNIFKDAVRIFMLNNTDHMVSKLALWKYLKNKYGTNNAATMIPYTWDLTDDNDIEIFKNQYDPNKIYLTKNNRQRQEGIEIHTSLENIIKTKDKYILVQELLQDPYLVNGRKINLRVYVLIIKDNYGNIKLQIYKDGFMYYSNDLFKKNDSSFGVNITTGYVDRQIYVENPLTHLDFRSYLDDCNRQLTDIEKYYRSSYPKKKLSDYIFSQMYQLIAFIFQTFEDIVGTITYGVSFQLYGVDIAINEKLKPMIMEINKGPDITAKDDRDKELKINMCKDILKSVGLIPNENNNFLTVLELVNINGKLLPINNFIEY